MCIRPKVQPVPGRQTIRLGNNSNIAVHADNLVCRVDSISHQGAFDGHELRVAIINDSDVGVVNVDAGFVRNGREDNRVLCLRGSGNGSQNISHWTVAGDFCEFTGQLCRGRRPTIGVEVSGGEPSACDEVVVGAVRGVVEKRHLGVADILEGCPENWDEVGRTLSDDHFGGLGAGDDKRHAG